MKYILQVEILTCFTEHAITDINIGTYLVFTISHVRRQNHVMSKIAYVYLFFCGFIRFRMF